MNPWHLLWIIPLSMTVGAFMACVLIGGTQVTWRWSNDFNRNEKESSWLD
jgi:hypothetical protein